MRKAGRTHVTLYLPYLGPSRQKTLRLDFVKVPCEIGLGQTKTSEVSKTSEV